MLLPIMSFAASTPTYQFYRQISGNGNIYSGGNTVDFCGAYNTIDVGNIFGPKIPSCQAHLKINESFSQSILEQVTVLNGSVINGTGLISLALNTQIPNSNANLQYILFFGSHSEPPFVPQDSSTLDLGKDEIAGISVPFSSFAGGFVEDLTDWIVTYSGLSGDIVSPIVNKIVNVAAISGSLNSVASLTERIQGNGFDGASTINWSSSGTRYLNLNFSGSNGSQTLYLTPISRQNLSIGFGISFASIPLDIFSVPVHPVTDFSNFSGNPINISWYKVVINQEGTGGRISPSTGTRWYVQGYNITLNVTTYSANSFEEFKIYEGDNTFAQPIKELNQSELPYVYTVTEPVTIDAEFANAPSSPIDWIILVVVIILLILWFLLRKRRY
ncbi:MAG: hypothetical protein KGH72_05015 [Candidatus Micrarchaeota archaeon]|nr:hypothetical protein [Candidatus Micrarchaeota archaeon]